MIAKLFIGALILFSSLNASNELNVYTHRNYFADKQLFEMFEKETGIKVNITVLDSSEVVQEIQSDGEDTDADVLVTVDAARLVYAQYKGLLQAVISKKLQENVPSHLRQKDGYWYGVTKRARIIAYNKKRIDPSQLSTYEDLSSPKWKKKLLIGKSSELYNLSLVSSLIAHDGEESVTKWAKGIVKNMARRPSEGDTNQIKALAYKRGDIAIINTYYLGKLINSKKNHEVELTDDLGVFFPNQKENERGTHINISGMGVVKHSKNKENAIKFIEFMVSPKAQKMYAEASYEYPVNPAVEPSKLLKSWGKFKEDKINLEVLGYYNHKAVKVFNKADWD